jgi:hypothetical protein
MIVQRFDSELRYSLGWGWRFVKCGDVLNGLWRAQFDDVTGGRPRSASMAISFGRGSVSGAGAVITLASIDQEDTLVTGTWRRGDEQGWIRLRAPAEPPTNLLDGEWGKGIDPGRQVIGRFSAQRVR